MTVNRGEDFDEGAWARSFATLVGAGTAEAEVEAIHRDRVVISYRVRRPDQWQIISLMTRALELEATVQVSRDLLVPERDYTARVQRARGWLVTVQFPVEVFRKPPFDRQVRDSQWHLTHPLESLDQRNSEEFE
ncbi:hypothetical protein OG401_14415 [Kitasatospora purpeofusca]|uniref:hypothetical protein n=1 Tax=Kitasatospora purpeofusca TaxID=67352 RepID=UPI00225059B5|nr:hypothetical protein [Kitasatospora purpeofusca]MCX4685493.1 hypothetical protein [Kitasatospora purpeofusca]